MKKKIYIGSGWMHEQILWLLPLIYGYAKKDNIKEIIVERDLDKELVKKNPNLNFFLKEFKITTINRPKKIYVLLSGIINFFLILKIYFSLNRKNILSHKLNWTFSQLLHGSWDQINISKKDNKDISFFKKLKIITYGVYKFSLAKKLSAINVSTAFLSHSVYYERFMLASFREEKIDTFCQAITGIYKQKVKNDVSWSDVELELFNKFYKKPKFINAYWKKRLKGKGNYQTANYSTNKNRKLNVEGNFNLVLLHVFKDSPFNVIDRKRILADYFHWINETLKIIKDSDEIWYFKIHPIAKKWGEDQVKVFDYLLKKIYKTKPKNIVLIKYEYSNLRLISSAKKIITFHGTAHVESICLGKKPIVIQRSPIRKISKNVYIKPLNLKQYRKYLLSKDPKQFLVSKKETQIGKTFLYIRENIHSLTHRVKRIEYYRKDPKKLGIRSFNSVNKTMKQKPNLNFFINQGKFLSQKKQTHTLNN